MYPKVSIIIPCYNIEKHIGKCVESIINQTYVDFELILVDDGSTDNTLSICQDYKKRDTRLKVFSHLNKGVSYSRNRGISIAEGVYIMFIDGDDYISADFIEKHINAVEKDSCVISGMINVKKGIRTQSSYYKRLLTKFPKNIIGKDKILKALKYHSLSSPCAKVYFKSIIDKNHITFDENVSYQEDLLFNLNYLLFIKQLKLIDYFGYHYIEHEISPSIKFYKNFDHTEILFEKIESYINNEDDKLIFEEFVFQTLMRKIVNLYANTTTINKKTIQNKKKINEIFESEYIKYFEKYIYKSNVNIFLKLILKYRLNNLLFFYFSIKNKF